MAKKAKIELNERVPLRLIDAVEIGHKLLNGIASITHNQAKKTPLWKTLRQDPYWISYDDKELYFGPWTRKTILEAVIQDRKKIFGEHAHQDDSYCYCYGIYLAAKQIYDKYPSERSRLQMQYSSDLFREWGWKVPTAKDIYNTEASLYKDMEQITIQKDDKQMEKTTHPLVVWQGSSTDFAKLSYHLFNKGFIKAKSYLQVIEILTKHFAIEDKKTKEIKEFSIHTLRKCSTDFNFKGSKKVHEIINQLSNPTEVE